MRQGQVVAKSKRRVLKVLLKTWRKREAYPGAKKANAKPMKRTVFTLKKGGGAWFKLARKRPRKGMK